MTNLKSITKTCLAVLFSVMLSLTIGFSLLFKNTNASTGINLTLSDIQTMGLNFTVQKTKIREAITNYDSSQNEIIYGYSETEDGAGTFNYPSLQNFYTLYTLTEDEYHNEIFTEAEMYSTTASQIPNTTYDSGSFLPTDYDYDKLFYQDSNGDYKDVFYDADMVNNEVTPSGSYFIIQNYETKNNLSKGITTSERVDNLYLSFGDYYTTGHELNTTIVSLKVSAKLYNKSYGTKGIAVGTKYNEDILTSGELGETYFGSVIPQTGLDINGDNRVNYFWYSYLDLENIYCVDKGTEYGHLFGNKLSDTEGRYDLTFTFVTYKLGGGTSSTYKFDYSFYLINEDSFINYPEFNESVTAGSSENMEVEYRNYYYNFLNREYPTYIYDPTKFNISYTHNYNDVINEYSTTFKNTANYTYNNNTNVTYDANLYSVFKNVYSSTGNSTNTTVSKEFEYSIATFSVINRTNESNGETTAYHFYFKSKDNATSTNALTFLTQSQGGTSLKIEGLSAFDFIYSEKIVYTNKTYTYEDKSDVNNTYTAKTVINDIKVYNSEFDTLDYENLFVLDNIDSYYDIENKKDVEPFTLYNKELTLDINFYNKNNQNNTINRTYLNYYFQANSTIDKDLLLTSGDGDEFNNVSFDKFIIDTNEDPAIDTVKNNIDTIIGLIKNNNIKFNTEEAFKNLFKLEIYDKDNITILDTVNLLNYNKNYTIINSDYAFSGNTLNSGSSDVKNVIYYNLNEKEISASNNHIITTNNISFTNDYDALTGTDKLLYSINAINNIVNISNKADLTIKLEFKSLGKFDVITNYSVSSAQGQNYPVCENETSYNLKVNVKNDSDNRTTKGITLSGENIVAISGLPSEVMESGNGGLKEETVQNNKLDNYKYTYTPIFKTLIGEDYIDPSDNTKYKLIDKKDNDKNINARYVCKVDNYIVSYRKQQSITMSYTDGTTVTTTYSDDIYDYRTLGYELFVVQDEDIAGAAGRYYAYKKLTDAKFTFVKDFINYENNDNIFYIINKEFSNLCNEQNPDQVYLGEIYDYSQKENIPVKISVLNKLDFSDNLFKGQKVVIITNSETNHNLYKGFYDEANKVVTLTHKYNSTEFRYLIMTDSEEFLEVYDGTTVTIDSTDNDGNTIKIDGKRAIIKNNFEVAENGLILTFNSGILANSFRNVTIDHSGKVVYSYTTQTGASDTDETFNFIYSDTYTEGAFNLADIKLSSTGDSIFYPDSTTYYVNYNNIYSAYNYHPYNKTFNTFTTEVDGDKLIINEGQNALTSIAPQFDGYSLFYIDYNVLVYIKLSDDKANVENLLVLRPNSEQNSYLYTFTGISVNTFNERTFDTTTNRYSLGGLLTGTKTSDKYKTLGEEGFSDTEITGVIISAPNSGEFGNKSSYYLLDDNKKIILKLNYKTSIDDISTPDIDETKYFQSTSLMEGGFNHVDTIDESFAILKGRDFHDLVPDKDTIYLCYNINAYDAYLFDRMPNDSSDLALMIATSYLAKGSRNSGTYNFYFAKDGASDSEIKTIALSLNINDNDLIKDGKTNERIDAVKQTKAGASSNTSTFEGMYDGEPVKITYEKVSNTNTNLVVKIYSTATDSEILKQTGYYSQKININNGSNAIEGYITGSNTFAYITITNHEGQNVSAYNNKTFNYSKINSSSSNAVFEYTYKNQNNIEKTYAIKINFDSNSVTLIDTEGIETTGYTLSFNTEYFAMHINGKENVGTIKVHNEYQKVESGSASHVFTNTGAFIEKSKVTNNINVMDKGDGSQYDAYVYSYKEYKSAGTLDAYKGKYIQKTDSLGNVTYVLVDDYNFNTLDIVTDAYDNGTPYYEITFNDGSTFDTKDEYVNKFIKNTVENYYYVDENNLKLDADGNLVTSESNYNTYNIDEGTTKIFNPTVITLPNNETDNLPAPTSQAGYYGYYIYTGIEDSEYKLVTENNFNSLKTSYNIVVGSTPIYTINESKYYESVGTRSNKNDYIGFYFRTETNARYVRITAENLPTLQITAGNTECYRPIDFTEIMTAPSNYSEYIGHYVKIENTEYTLVTNDNKDQLVTIDSVDPTKSTTVYYFHLVKDSQPADANGYLGKYIYYDTDSDSNPDTYILVSDMAYVLNDTTIYTFGGLTTYYQSSGTTKTTLTFKSGEYSNKFSKKTIVSEFQDILVQSSGISKNGKTLNVIGNIGLFNKDGYVEFKDETNKIYSDVTNDLNDYYKYESAKIDSLESNKKDEANSMNLYNVLNLKNTNNENKYWQGISLKQQGSSNVFETIATYVPVTNLPPVKFNYYCTYAYDGLVSESYIYRYKNYKVSEDGKVTVTRSGQDWLSYKNDNTTFDYYTELFTKNTILNDDGYYEIVIKFNYDGYDIGKYNNEVFYQVFSFVIDKTDPEFTLEKEVEKVDKNSNKTYLTWANYENNYYTNGNVRISWRIPNYFQAPITPYLSKINYAGIVVGTDGSDPTPYNNTVKFPETAFVPYSQTLRLGNSKEGIEQTYIYEYVEIKDLNTHSGDKYIYDNATGKYILSDEGTYKKVVVRLMDSTLNIQDINLTNNGYYLEKDTRSYLYFFSDNSSSIDLTYWGSGNYQARFTYGASGLSYSTTSFKVDTMSIKGMQIIPIVSTDKGYIYSDVKFTSGSDSYINQPFSFIYNAKESGASISTTYYRIPFKDLTQDTIQLLLSNDDLGVSANSAINGISNNSNTEKPYYYNYNIKKYGQVIKNGNEFIPDDSCLYMFKLKDSAGNTAQYFTLFDKTNPNYIIETDEEYNERYNIVTDTAELIWGDYKAIEVFSATSKTITNGNISTTNQGYVNNHFVFDGADDPTATTLSIILRDIVQDETRPTKKYKGSILKRFLKTTTADNTEYNEIRYVDVNGTPTYQIFKDGAWHNETNLVESNITYFLLVPLQSVEVEYYKTNSDDVKHYTYEYNINNLSIPTSHADKLQGKFENHAIAYPKLNIMQQDLVNKGIQNGDTYTLQGPYGFYGEQQYYFTISDILYNETLTTLWMNFDKAQAFGKGNFMLANAQSIDDLYDSYLDLENAFSVSQLYFSYYPESMDNGIPASEVSYKHYNFDINNNYNIQSITYDNTLQKYVITFTDGNTHVINIAKLDENERSEPNSSYPFSIKPTAEEWNVIANEEIIKTNSSSFKDINDLDRWYSPVINQTSNTKLQNVTEQGLYVFKRVYVNYLTTDESGNISYNTYSDEYDKYKGELNAWFKSSISDFENWLNHITTTNDTDKTNDVTYNGNFWLVNNKLKSYNDLVNKIIQVKASGSSDIFNNLEINDILDSMIWEQISLVKGFVVVDLGYDTITRYYVYYVDRNGIITELTEFSDSVSIGGDIKYTLGSEIDGVGNYKDGYEFEYTLEEILAISIEQSHDEAYASGISNNLFDTNKEYVEFNLPIDKYNENNIYLNFFKNFIESDDKGFKIIDSSGNRILPDNNNKYTIKDSNGNVINLSQSEIISTYGELDYVAINRFLSGNNNADYNNNLTYLKALLGIVELDKSKLTAETKKDYNKKIRERLDSYINRTLFNIYSETVFELNLNLTLNGYGIGSNPEIEKPVRDNEINKLNNTNKYVLESGDIKNPLDKGIDRTDENITTMYLFQPNNSNSYDVNLKDTGGIWVLKNEYANEYGITFRINNVSPEGTFYGKNDSNYKTNTDENNYAQNMFDVEKNDLSSMIEQDYLSKDSEQNGLTIFTSTNNQSLIFVFEDVESEKNIAKINPYEITITKQYVNSSGQIATETIFRRSRTKYPDAPNYIYDEDEKKAQKMRTAFIENLDKETAITKQWGVVIFDAFAANENFHDILSNPNDNAIYKVTLQYYGEENNYTYYDNVNGNEDATNNGSINDEQTVSFFYGNFEIVEDNIKPLYNLIQLMDNDNFIPLTSDTKLNNATSKIQGVTKTYSEIDILVLEILRNRLNIKDEDILNEEKSNKDDLTNIFKILDKTLKDNGDSKLTSQDRLYMQYAMNLIYEEYYKSYTNAELGYFKDNDKNNILAKDYLQNYFFAVTEEFNFTRLSTLDNTALYFRKISDPSNYRFSLTMDDFKTTTGDLQNNNHQVFIEANATDLNSSVTDYSDDKFYRISFDIDKESNEHIEAHILNVGELINLGYFKIGDYIEIIERDEAGNFRVYGIHVTTSYNGLTYSYLDTRNYKNTKTIGIQNNGVYTATINGTGFEIGDYIQYSSSSVVNNKLEYDTDPNYPQDGFLKAEITYRFSKNIGTIDNPNYQDHSTVTINDKEVTEYYYNTKPIVIYLNPINNKIFINYGDCSLIYIYRFENDENYKDRSIFYSTDFEDIIEKICDSITGENYGLIATDFRININFIERTGENISITYNYPGALLKYRKTISSKGFTITIPEDNINRSTIIVNFYAYRYINGNWQLLDTDDNNIRIIQGDGLNSLGGKTGASYFFTTGSYKFTLIDNFGRSASYFERFQVGSVEPTLSFKNFMTYENEKYTAQEVTLQYDATIYVPYVFYYYNNGSVNTSYLDIVEGVNNKQLNDLDYKITLKKSTAFSEGNVNILTITPPDTETHIKFEIHLVDISTGEFENKEYYYNINLGENKNLVTVMPFHFYTILPKLEVTNTSGLLLDAKNQNFIEDLILQMNEDDCPILFNAKMVIIRNVDNKKITTESNEQFTVKESGKYNVYITNDLKHNSDQIEFTRSEGDATYYAVRASESYNSSSYALLASTITETYGEKVLDKDGNEIIENGKTKINTYPMYLYFAQNSYANYLVETDLNGHVSYKENTQSRHIEIITNTNRGIDYELVYLENPIKEEEGSNKINKCDYAIYKITMGTTNTSIQTFRYIKVTFIESRSDNYTEMEILNSNGNPVQNCNKDLITQYTNVKTVTDYITVKFTCAVDETYPANEIYLKHYVNNSATPEIVRLKDLPYVTDEDNEIEYYYYKTNITGLHSFSVYDLANNKILFNTLSEDSKDFKDHFNIFLINGVRYSLNGDEDSINNQIYNSEVLLSVVYSIRTDDTTITLYNDDVEISATRNGKLHEIVETSTNTFSFTESGYYEVTLSGVVVLGENETSQQNVITRFAFRIVNANSAMPSFDISKSKGFELLEIQKKTENTENSYFVPINVEFYNQELSKNYSNLTLWLNSFDENSGNGYYYIRMRAYVESISAYKEFEFNVWINEEYPTITCNKEYGSTTKEKIKLSYNPYSIYTMVGNSKIVITRGKTVVDTIVIDENATNTTETYTITTKGEYWIQIFTEDDKLITSYKITKKDPLNSTAVLVIILVCVGVVVLTVIFIILRRRAKFK